jgi:hypothetical protein
VLFHHPANGIKSFVEVYAEADARLLRITRTVSEGTAAGWTVRYRGDRARGVDLLVDELGASSDVAASCPRRHGRDGILWGVKFPSRGVEYAFDFRIEEGGPGCARLEAAATELMKLANLECASSACLRPEEQASGYLTCAAGEAGRGCREALREREP